MKKILVIKLSALGDITLASAPFAAIRQHHSQDHLTLLTTAPYRDFAQKMGYFDEILIDPRLRLKDWKRFFQFRSLLLAQNFSRVYDLQLVSRTNLYFHVLGFKNRTEWCGSTQGGYVYYPFQRQSSHVLERFREFLHLCSIETMPNLNLRHLAESNLPVSLPSPFALLIPGASPTHPEKRWSPEGFASVGRFLNQQGIQPVIIGGPGENNEAITHLCPQAIDLTGKTSLIDIITLSSQAHLAIGNDTGPLHLAGASQCPVIGLHTEANSPQMSGAVSPKTLYFTAANLKALPSEEVIQKLEIFLASLLK